MLRVQTACSAASSLLELFRARVAPPPSRAALVPHSAMTLHVVIPLLYLSHLRSAAMGLPYSSEPGRFPQWHCLEAVLEGPETENWPVLQLFCD